MKKLFIALTVSVLSFSAYADDASKLKAVGALGGISIYSIYLSIGSAADAFEKGVYKAETVAQVTSELMSLCKNGAQTFVDLKKAKDLQGEDVGFAMKMVTIFKDLSNQAGALKAYAASGKKRDAKKFQKHRTKAWAGVKEVLGLP